MKKKKKKKAISPASVQMRSTVKIKAISPKGESSTSKTIGLVMTAEEARELGANLIAVSYDRNTTGDITATGKKKSRTVTVIRNIR